MKGTVPAILLLLLAASHLADAQQPKNNGKKKVRQAPKKLAKIVPELPPPAAKRQARPRKRGEQDLKTRPKSMSSDLWIYLQERKRAQDPRYLVRQKAAAKAARRRARLATMKWIGYSNARPVASPTPLFSKATPHFGLNGLSFAPDGGFWSVVAFD